MDFKGLSYDVKLEDIKYKITINARIFFNED